MTLREDVVQQGRQPHAALGNAHVDNRCGLVVVGRRQVRAVGHLCGVSVALSQVKRGDAKDKREYNTRDYANRNVEINMQ